MKKLLSVSLCLLFAASMAAQTGKIRVATVGNSITGGTNDYGYYAMPLAEMLGDDYERLFRGIYKTKRRRDYP